MAKATASKRPAQYTIVLTLSEQEFNHYHAFVNASRQYNGPIHTKILEALDGAARLS